ncbi:hypothetical protein HQ585_19720 [candidate division KSB1 bacterium]|nr:hypothetical protein [candidate division KSB1 bacterium]
MGEIKLIRLTGFAGILGALLMFTGDMFLYGGFYSGSEYYDYSRRIMGEIPLLRLMIGGAIGPIASILYAIGFWQIYFAIKSAGKILASISFSGFAFMIIIAGSYHSGFVNTGLILRAKASIQQSDLESVKILLSQSIDYLHFLYNIMFVFGTIGTISFLYTIISRKTYYPKWIILFTPTLLLLASSIATYIPSPVGGIIYGGYINLIFLLFFCVSTFSLWHGGRRLE